MTNLPWMQIFIGDELAEASGLSAEEYGAHMLLRLHQWKHGDLPSDEDRLMRICRIERDRWPSVKDVLAPLYDWVWHHQRTADVRRESEEKHANLSANGRKGGRPPKQLKADGKPNESQAFDRVKAEVKADGKQSQSQSQSPLHSDPQSESPPQQQSDIGALDKEGKNTGGSLFAPYRIPTSAAAARKLLSDKGVPQARLDECVRLMMGGNFSPYDLEGVITEARSAAA